MALIGEKQEEAEQRFAGELLEVEAIDRSGLAVTSEGAFVRAIEVTPPNTLLLSEEERGRLARGYGQLLSRLRPGQALQFYIEIRPLALGSLLDDSRRQVEAAAGPLTDLAVLAPDDAARWRLNGAMEQSVLLHANQQAAVRMRTLVIVPYMPDSGSRGNQLRSLGHRGVLGRASLERDLGEHRRAAAESLAHTEMIRGELDGLRLPARLLNGEEMAELWFARFNPSASDAGRALRSEVLCDLDTPRSIEQARVAAERLRGEIAQSALDVSRDRRHIEIDRDVEQVIYANTTADATFLGALLGPQLTREPFALSVFVHALDRHNERRRVKNGYRRVFAINRGAEQGGRTPDFDRYGKEQEMQGLLADMAGHSRTSIFRVAIYQSIRVKGPNADLRRLSAAIDSCADEIALATDARVNKGEFRQRDLWLSTLPLGRDVADRGRRYATQNAADLVPLSGTTCGSPQGIPFGFSEPLRTLELLDPWDRSHSNFLGILAGRSGSGKTMTANVILSRCIAAGAQAFAIDRAGHYGVLTNLIPSAQEIPLGAEDAHFAINPWDVPDPASVGIEKISFLLALHSVMMGAEGLTVMERGQLGAAIRGVYLNAALSGTKPRESMLRDELRSRAGEEEAPEIAAALRNLAERLNEFCGDGVYAYLADRETTVTADSPLVIFDTRSCPEEIIAPQMFSILEFCQRRIEAKISEGGGGARWSKRSILLLDEAWHLLRRPETASYANDLARRSRHLGLFFLVSTQQVSDFDSPEGIALVRNSTMQFLLSQQPDEIPFITQALGLSDEEAALLGRLNTVKGSHSEIFWANGTRGRGKVALRIGPLEYWAFTSEPIHDAPLRQQAILEHGGDVWAAITELAADGEATQTPAGVG